MSTRVLVEAIREGYLLHYEQPRLIDGADGDLRLLAGDYLYALGLEKLADRGDLDAVRELADLISLSAQVHAENGDGSPRRWHGPLARRRPSRWAREQPRSTSGRRRPCAARSRTRPIGCSGALPKPPVEAGMSDALALAADSIGFAAEDVPDRG